MPPACGSRCWSSTAPTSPSFTGCNTGSGSYTVEGAEITFGPLATTRIACEGDSQVVEQAMLTVLTGTATFEIEGDVLTLTNGTDGLVLRGGARGRHPPEGLEGVPWLLDSIVDANTTSAVAPGVRQPTLEFDGTDVAVDTGCNTGSAGYTVEGDQITFGPMAMTLIAVRARRRRSSSPSSPCSPARRRLTIADGVLTLMNGDQGLDYTSE